MKTGIYLSVTGKLVELRKAKDREDIFLYRGKNFYDNMFGTNHFMDAPYDLVLDESELGEHIIFLDKHDAELLLDSFEYLGPL